MQTLPAHRYVVTDDKILKGEPIIRGTRRLVRALVEMWWLRIAPEEIPQRPFHFSLTQLFDALSYCSDHQEEINASIGRNWHRQER